MATVTVGAIRARGCLAIYDDRFLPYARRIGVASNQRASYVEPDPEHPQEWTVDFAPLGGPKFGGFRSRGEALEFEKERLRQFIETKNWKTKDS